MNSEIQDTETLAQSIKWKKGDKEKSGTLFINFLQSRLNPWR